MPKVLVVDESRLIRELLADVLRGHRYTVSLAGHGREALQICQDDTPDVLVCELDLPELDGFAILKVLRKNPHLQHLPVVVLSAAGTVDHVMRAAELHISAFILKAEFSIDNLLERLEKAMGHTMPTESIAEGAQRHAEQRAGPAGAMGPGNAPAASGAAERRRAVKKVATTITKEELMRLVTRGLELRPLGAAVANVLSITSNPECSAEDVAKVIGRDQAIAIRLLKLANSTAYARGRPVDDIKDAVQRIGIGHVRSLVMTLGVVEQYEGISATYVTPHLFWEHSMATGLLAARIARQKQFAEAEHFLMWGTLHDVGRLILLDHVPRRYATAWDTADELALPMESVEAKVMLLNHCDILERALEHWNFARDFIVPVVNHHRSPLTIRRLGAPRAERAATIALADRLVNCLMIGSSGNDTIYALEEWEDLLDVEGLPVADLAAEVRQEASNLKTAMLARACSEPWVDHAEALRAQITGTFRPNFVNAGRELDALRLSCERLADSSPEAGAGPNVNVVYLADAREQNQLFAELQQQEHAGDLPVLPAVIACNKGRVDETHAWLRQRPTVLLRMPVRISALIAGLNQLLS